MAATPISIFVRVLGIWKRVDPPHVNVSGVWKKCTGVYVKVSGAWKACFVDDVGALSANNQSLIGLDLFSPFSCGAGYRLQADGDLETWETPPDTLFAFSNKTPGWLKYDLSRTYQAKFTDITVGGHNLDSVPTLDTWLGISSALSKIESSRTTEGTENGQFDVEFRRNDGSPTATLRTIQAQVLVEAGSP